MTSPEKLLSRSQRNDLFRVLEKSGAPVSEFRLEAGSRNLRPAGELVHGVYVHHDASKSFFFIEGSGVHSISGSITNGDPSMTAVHGSGAFIRALELEQRRARTGSLMGAIVAASKGMAAAKLSWDEVVPLVEKWAQAVVTGSREYEAIPDLWAELQQSREVLAGHPDNTPFSPDEQAEISRHMQQVRTFVSTVPELTADQLSEVNNRLDEMEEASRRAGRKDWLLMFSGAVFGLILPTRSHPRSRSGSSCWASRGWATCSASGVPRCRCRKKN